jgi:hypothetical protein
MNIQQAIRFIGLPGLLVCLFFSQSCRKKQDPNPSRAPTIGTTTVINVTYNSIENAVQQSVSLKFHS